MHNTHKWPVSTTLVHTTQFVYFGLLTFLLKRSVLLFACFKNAMIKIDNYSNLANKIICLVTQKQAKTMCKVLPLSVFCTSSLLQYKGAN